MTDNDPDTFELDIDRDALRRYLRVRWFISWVAGLAFFAGMIGLAAVSGRLDNHDYTSVRDILVLFSTGLILSLLGSFALSSALYFLFSHRLASVTAANLRVIVEGPFLRIIQHGRFRMDRKIHFRSIVDYTTLEGPLMRRFGVMTLQMTTTGGGNQTGLTILGIRGCPRVRDKLAEIDALRENG